MAYGKPSAISTVCGSAEVVQDGVNGFTFPAGDAEAWPPGSTISCRAGGGRADGRDGQRALQGDAVQQAAPVLSGFIEQAVERTRRTG